MQWNIKFQIQFTFKFAFTLPSSFTWIVFWHQKNNSLANLLPYSDDVMYIYILYINPSPTLYWQKQWGINIFTFVCVAMEASLTGAHHQIIFNHHYIINFAMVWSVGRNLVVLLAKVDLVLYFSALISKYLRLH